MKQQLVISGCDYTGNMVRPWAVAGHHCICVDIRQEKQREEFESGGVIEYIEADLFDWLPPLAEYRAGFFFPECTNLAGSGARWFKSKGLRGLARGIALVERCSQLAEWIQAPYMIENPVGVLSSYWREPDYIFQPWMYGENESKATCIWTGGGFVMPEALEIARPADVKQSVWRMGPSADRGRKRSVTSPVFAQAVFEANAKLQRTYQEVPRQSSGAIG